MKQINKYRLTNKYLLVSMLALFLTLIISWFFQSGFFEIMFQLDYNAPDLGGLKSITEISELRFEYLDQILTWERMIDSSMYYMSFFFPIFALLPTIGFLKERESYLNLGAAKFLSYKRETWKTCFKYGFIGGAGISLTMGVYFTAFTYFLSPALDDIGGFDNIFSEGFYHNHPYVFFMFMAFSIYFAFGFVFALMGCGVALWTDKSYLVLLLPLIFYTVENYISATTQFFPVFISLCVTAFNTTYSTFEVFIPLIPILIFDLILIGFGIRRKGVGI